MKNSFFHLFVLFLFFVISCQTQSPKICVDEADQLVAAQNVDAAILLYQQCIQKDSKEPVYYLNQAALLMRQKRTNQAERAYGGVLTLSPDSYWPYVGLAKVYLTQESYDDAESILKQGLSSVATTQTAPILFYLGKTAYVKGEGESAAAYFTQALDQKFNEPELAYYFRGLVYENLLKDTAKALEDYKASLTGTSFDDQRITEIKNRMTQLPSGQGSGLSK